MTLVVFETFKVASGFYANPPFVTKILDNDFLYKKDIFVNIHPSTAAEAHLAEGAGDQDRDPLRPGHGQGPPHPRGPGRASSSCPWAWAGKPGTRASRDKGVNGGQVGADDERSGRRAAAGIHGPGQDYRGVR